MASMPCKNPSCHSHGQPHPNCKCYQGMAKGGEASYFCSKDRAHDKGCQYFAGGGGVAPNAFGFVPDEPSESAKPTASASHNDFGFVPDKEGSTGSEFGFVPDSPDEPDEKYSSLGQRILGDVEAAGEGVLGGIPAIVETKLFGMDPEGIAGRAAAFPVEHGIIKTGALGASLAAGVGLPGAIAKGASAIGKVAQLSKLGTALITGALETASFAASDEITKAMLSKPGSDAESPVSAALLNVGTAGIMGLATGGVFGLGQKLMGSQLQRLNDPKVQDIIVNYLAKVGATGDPLGKLGVTHKIKEGIVKGLAATIASKTDTGIVGYEVLESGLRPVVEKITKKPINKANSYVTAAILKSIQKNEIGNAPNAIRYATRVGEGVQKALSGVDALFKAGESQISKPASEAALKELHNFIEEGQVDKQLQNTLQSNETSSTAPEAFAKGGVVSAPPNNDQRDPNDISAIFPEQNALLSAAKGRISGYLNSIRPLPNQPKLAFDPEPSNKDKKRSYEKALAIGVNPLSILDKVNKGSLTPEDMTHFTQMYPEVHRYLTGAMTKRIIEAQLSGQKPPYGKRQAMSLFMGANLDSSLTPQAIQAAQSVFVQKQQAQQMPMKNKKGTSSLSKVSQNYQTASQSRQERQQKG